VVGLFFGSHEFGAFGSSLGPGMHIGVVPSLTCAHRVHHVRMRPHSLTRPEGLAELYHSSIIST